MQKTFLYSALLLTLGVIAVAQKLEAPPTWAFAVAGPEYQQPVDDGTLRHVPNSTAGWTLTQLRDPFFAPDWHPEEHPAMPEVVARGRKPDVYACGFCHRADGSGGPENANLAGLPEAYIVQQMADFKSGARKSAVSEHLPSVAMAAIGKAAREEEVGSAAGYFSGLKPRKLITVVEANEVPQERQRPRADWYADHRNAEGSGAIRITRHA